MKRKYTLKDVISDKDDQRLKLHDEVFFADMPHICLRRALGKEKCVLGSFEGTNDDGYRGPFIIKVGPAVFDSFYLIRRKQ